MHPSVAMKRLFLRLQRYHARYRTRRRQQPALSLYTEMSRGSLIGFVVCLLAAVAVSDRTGPTLWAALFGAGLGALSGLLVWLGSDQLDEQPVIPPHRPRWRAENAPPHRFPQRRPIHPVLSSDRPLFHADSGRHPVHPRAHRKR